MRIRNFQQKISTAWILSGFVFGMILWLSPFVNDAVGCGPPPCYTCPPCYTGCYCDNYVGCPTCDSSECLQCGAGHCTCTSWCSGGTCCHGNCCLYPGMNCCPDGHCCSSGYSCCGNKCCHPGTTHCCSDGPPGSEYYCCPDGQTCCHGNCCVPSACDECVDGTCKVCGGRPNESCCNGSCYNTITQKCCGDTGTGYKCDINEICCNGSCCNPNECKDCNATTHACESRCNPENCETCDGAGHCIVCSGDTTKCCQQPSHTCVKKCDPVGAPCPYETPNIQAGCQRQGPSNFQCIPDQVDKTCQWGLVYQHSSSAKCADCAPFCSRSRDDYCAFYKAETCRNALFIGCVCNFSGDEIARPKYGDGDHYICN